MSVSCNQNNYTFLLSLKFNLAFQESDHPFKARWFLPQDTLKFGCPAKIVMSEVIKFPDYKVNLIYFTESLSQLPQQIHIQSGTK